VQESFRRLSEWQSARAAARAAFHGDLIAVEWMLRRQLNMHLATHVCAAAAAGGQLQALQLAWDLGCPCNSPDDATCSAAAYGGHLEVLKWARQ
jgi:hypothetical protein